MKHKKKGKNLVAFVESVTKVMSENSRFDRSIYKRSSSDFKESVIQRNIFDDLRKKLPQLINTAFGTSEAKCKKEIDEILKFEGNIKTKVTNLVTFGVGNRPDAKIILKDSDNTFCLEIKKGKNSQALRSGLGQSLLYSTRFDFVIYFFVDTSDTGDIKNGQSADEERLLIKSLWDNYNIKFQII